MMTPLVFLSLIYLAFADECDMSDAVPADQFSALLALIDQQPFEDGKLAVLLRYTTNLTRGFQSDQLVQLLARGGFVETRKKILTIVNKFVLTLTAKGGAAVLNALSFSNEKMETLRMLVPFIPKSDLLRNNQTLLACFSFSSDKAEALKIILAAKPRSCIWGDTSLKYFDFIVDVSGSMKETFRDDSGRLISRLAFVQRELARTITDNLSPSQSFNIIAFSTNAVSWKPGVVPVNSSNIQSAIDFVNRLVPIAATNMIPALQLAIRDPAVLGAYLLSDGDPSDNQLTILNLARQWGKPVNTIAFKAEPSAQKFMEMLAKESKGTFRAIK